jgi:hypothetical protein
MRGMGTSFDEEYLHMNFHDAAAIVAASNTARLL